MIIMMVPLLRSSSRNNNYYCKRIVQLLQNSSNRRIINTTNTNNTNIIIITNTSRRSVIIERSYYNHSFAYYSSYYQKQQQQQQPPIRQDVRHYYQQQQQQQQCRYYWSNLSRYLSSISSSVSYPRSGIIIPITGTTTTTVTTRGHSTTTKATTKNENNNYYYDNNNNNTNDDVSIKLYERIVPESTSEQKRALVLMRSGLYFSCFHTIYWIWYTFDFVPLMNAAAAANPVLQTGEASIGYVGLAFASAIQAVFIIYPKRLISQIIWKPNTNQLFIYTHSVFPFIRPDPLSKPSFIVPTGTAYTQSNNSNKVSKKNDTLSTKNPIGITPDDNIEVVTKVTTPTNTTTTIDDQSSLLDPTLEQTKYVMTQLQGHIENYRGQLPIGYRWPYYLLDLHTTTNVKQPILLLEALLRAQYMTNQFDDTGTMDSRRGANTVGRNNKKNNRQVGRRTTTTKRR